MYVYALEFDDGVALIDSGWNAPRSLAELEAGLRWFGRRLEDVRLALFTHGHRDHYGLAGTLSRRAGAQTRMHAGDRETIAGEIGPQASLCRAYDELLALAGVADAKERRRMIPVHRLAREELPLEMPDSAMNDGERIALGKWDLEVVHTPGHSPGHACFYERATGFLFTGDHVLPRITPNISITPYSPHNPLEQYLQSLAYVRDLNPRRGLAAHVGVVESVAGRAQELLRHHELKLDLAADLVRGQPRTVLEVAKSLPWARPWEHLDPQDMRRALGEAHAHLAALELRGVIARMDESPLRWRT